MRIDTTIENRTASPLDLARSRLLDWKLRPTPVDDARYREMSPREDTWYGSTYWTGPDWTRVGRDWQHPGERTESVRRFTAPRDGRVSVRGRVAKAHLEGDGIRAEIRHRGRTIWTAEIEGKDAVGQAHEISLDVLEGEALRFFDHRRGAIPCDTTRWDPAIEYEGGPRFLASEGFSARAKDGPWTCETDVGEAAKVAVPRLLAFDQAWSVRETELAAADTPPPPIEENPSGSKLMPLLLLSDERQSSGVVLVGDPKTRWRAHCTTRPDGTIQIEVSLADGGDGVDSKSTRLEAGETRSLPAVVASPYRGSILDGLEALERLLGESAVASIACGLRDAIDAAGVPELPLWKMVQDEWRREDAIDEASIDSFARAIDRHSRDFRTLLDELKIRAGGLRAEDPRLAGGARELQHEPQRERKSEHESERESKLERDRNHERELQEILSAPLRLEGLKDELRERWTRLRSLKRRILLEDPPLARCEILFAKRAPTSYSHLVMQYYGWRARAGGGLFALEKPGRSLAARDLLATDRALATAYASAGEPSRVVP